MRALSQHAATYFGARQDSRDFPCGVGPDLDFRIQSRVYSLQQASLPVLSACHIYSAVTQP